MKRILLYLFMSIITIGIQAQVLVVETTDGAKSTYPVEAFQNATFISNAASQDFMIVKTTNGDKTEIPINKVNSIIIDTKYNGHEYVDLGLSVKWATCNVGASKPEEFGDYFAWGETVPKTIYNSSNCLISNNINTLLANGIIDSNYNLTNNYDAAYVNWGGVWRMPTDEEFLELEKKCAWSWTTIDGINGCKVTGPNGKSIFLPACGDYSDKLRQANSYGNYWSSSFDQNYSPYYKGSMSISDYLPTIVFRDGYLGFSVRAVCP